MLAILGERGAPQNSAASPEARRRVRSRTPIVVARCERLLRLAARASAGPDPESALPFLALALRTLHVFLKLTPK
jgi:hypothetical protein